MESLLKLNIAGLCVMCVRRTLSLVVNLRIITDVTPVRDHSNVTFVAINLDTKVSEISFQLDYYMSRDGIIKGVLFITNVAPFIPDL